MKNGRDENGPAAPARTRRLYFGGLCVSNLLLANVIEDLRMGYYGGLEKGRYFRGLYLGIVE